MKTDYTMLIICGFLLLVIFGVLYIAFSTLNTTNPNEVWAYVCNSVA